MPQHAHMAKVEVEEFLGEWHPLVDQLSSAEGLLPLSAATAILGTSRVSTVPGLLQLLESYRATVLIPQELPAILRAYRHTCRTETRELIAFDRGLANRPGSPALLRASERSGRIQLCRLRPLRDHRLLQRYLRAVETGQAHGWHTLVYGVTLSIYSLPVLQGLAFYERQTLRGFVQGAARTLHLTHLQCRAILNQLCADLPTRQFEDESRSWFTSSSR